MSAFLSSIGVVGPLLTIVLAAAAVWAWPKIRSRAIADVQDRVIAVQKSEIDTLTSQVASLTKEVARLTNTLNTVRYALKQKGTEVIIDDEYVTLRTTARPTAHSTSVRIKRGMVPDQIETHTDMESGP